MKIITTRGFTELFWVRVKNERSRKSTKTMQTIFDELNEEYFKLVGEYKYSCYDSFRHCRDRKL